MGSHFCCEVLHEAADVVQFGGNLGQDLVCAVRGLRGWLDSCWVWLGDVTAADDDWSAVLLLLVKFFFSCSRHQVSVIRVGRGVFAGPSSQAVLAVVRPYVPML